MEVGSPEPNILQSAVETRGRALRFRTSGVSSSGLLGFRGLGLRTVGVQGGLGFRAQGLGF